MNVHRISRTLIRLGAAITAAALLIPGCRKNEKNDLTVTEIIIVNPDSRYLDMTQGDGALIQYDVVPSEALTTAVLEWSSDNESVATVMNGYVSAYAPGNATITAKCGNAETTVTVSVKPVPVTSFTVPETLFLYTGYETVLEMTIEPEKANAASLDWEYDSEYLSMSFDEGKAVFTGLKKGNTTITVKSEKAGTKTVQVVIRDIESRLVVGYNKRTAGSYKTIILKDGDEVIWDQIYPSSDSYDPTYYPDITVVVGPDISISKDVKISCSNESICKEFRPLAIGTTDKRAVYTLYNGDGFGTADVTVTAYDQKFDTERKLQFKLTREAKGFPGELIVRGPKSTTIRNGDTYRMDKNTSAYFYVDDGYKVKWSVESGNALTLKHSGDVYWSQYAKATTADKTGPVTIKVTDQTGKSMSFTINVTEQVFPDDIYVMYEDGTRLKDGDELLIGHEYKFKLSNSNYVGKWDFEGNTSYANYATEVVYTPKICRLASDPLTLTVKDKSGTVTKEYKLSQKYSLEDCRFSISDKGPNSMTDGVSATNYIPWTGTSTNNEITLYLYYSDGNKQINPWQLSGADQNMNSGRLKIDIEYLSNGSALRQNNRVVFKQYYYHYKLTWKTAAGAFNIRFTDGNIVRKVPFYSTIDVKNLKDYAFFEYFSDSGAGSLMKNGEPSILCAYTNKANYNIMFAHTSNLTKDADGDWVFNAGLRDLAYSTETMGDVVAIESKCYQPRSSIYDYLIFHGITGKEVANSIAYKGFSYKSTEKPFYLYFKFKGATDSYGNTWPHDKYNLQRRSLWYL
jgi:hypothetical protein